MNKNALKDILITLLYVVVISLAFYSSVQSSIITGPSMQNTYIAGDRLFLNKLANDYNRGDVIAFHPQIEGREHEEYIKRIIGLPGEQVDIVSGVVTVTTADGSRHVLNEPYIKESPNYNHHSGVIPEGCYYVLGDNRNQSFDSHDGYFAEKDYIVGRVLFSYWPFSKIGSPNIKFDF